MDTTIFQQAYNREKWNDFLFPIFKDQCKDLTIYNPPLLETVDNNIAKQAYRLGEIKLSSGDIIAVYDVELQDNIKIAQNKVAIRNLLKQSWKYYEGAFIASYKTNETDWRFSFLSETKELTEDSYQKVKTQAKRYTYLLGENHSSRTVTERFKVLEKEEKTLANIKNAFSVEVLNKEFYRIVTTHFYQLVGATEGKGNKAIAHTRVLELPSIDSNNVHSRKIYQEFAVRLIGRIVFCWFLKKKKPEIGESLLPEHLLSSKAVKNNSGYYHSIIEKLFFQTLNTPINERIGDLPKGCEQIPFLNGGLFEPQTEDYYLPNRSTGISSHINTLKIPDEWFYDFFINLEQYNFTIDENSVLDVEISVDPEMLGRIFENLLAEIDPDSGESARNSTGSFYTPREIVDYMVIESLINYIFTQLQSEKETLTIEQRDLNVLFNIDEVIDDNSDIGKCKYDILESLHKLKILDPACGSGAFPMGVLQKIMMILQKLDPNAEWWKNKQVEKIDNAIVRNIIKQKLEQTTVEYAQKIGIIQNSLYGVDIQPIAAEISKLRCFLTLVVEEQIDDNKPNRGVEPLPNLEFKFITANTLLQLPIEQDLGGLFNSNDNLKKLHEIRKEYLQSYGDEKNELKEQFLTLQKEIAKEQLSLGIAIDVNSKAYKISTWNPFSHEKADWFDAEWMFGLNSGASNQDGYFDIVIGNPPYVFARNSKLKGITNKDKDYYYKNYKLSEYQINLYPLFIEAGTNFLKREGILSYITPNNWLTLNTNKRLRQFILEQSNITILNFHKRVFDSADVDAAVFIFQKNNKKDDLEKIKLAEWEKEFTLIGEVEKLRFLSIKDFVINIEVLKGSETFNLLDKIENNAVPLSEIADVKAALVAYETGAGNPPQKEEVKQNRVFHSKIGGKDYTKYLDGSDVCRYYLDWSGEFLKYGKHLAAPRKNFDIFSTPRILVRQIPSPLPYCINACFVEETLLNDRNSMNIIYIKISPLYLLGILNSRLISYWFAYKFGKLQRGIFPQFKINELAQFPVPNIAFDNQQPIISLVEQILSIKQQNSQNDTKKIEQEIDKLVYELYNLSEEEIEIIENS